MSIYSETTIELLDLLNQGDDYTSESIALLEAGQSRYLQDAKVNLKNALVSEHLNAKEIALTGLAIATNNNNVPLQNYFKNLATEQGATAEEKAEAIACASLLAANNVLYRFRHFMGKEKYHQLPARLRMNIMAKPVLGKEFFELISLAISAVNGCELCVKSHESSLLALQSTEERIFDAIRLAAVVTSIGKIIS